MKPSFYAVSQAYPRKPEYQKAQLFHMIGWDDLINNGNYDNTCAIRVNIALASAGMLIPGRMRIKAGKLKGRSIEPGQGRLAHLLTRPSMLGAPEIFRGNNEARKGIGSRKGVIAFWNLYSTPTNGQGHIDLVSPAEGGFNLCAGACYFDAKEIWFWPLK